MGAEPAVALRTMNQTDLADYLDTNLTDQISRIDGVGDVQVFGSPYAMRIWLDPSKLSAFGLSAADVVNAVSEENSQISAGAFGLRPTEEGQMLNATIMAPPYPAPPREMRRAPQRARGRALRGTTACCGGLSP